MTVARASKPTEPEHYSYAVYADPAMAESFDAMRFGGPIGRLLSESQERVITQFLSPLPGRTILDVGTGTGRAAIALALKGAVVTGVDASEEMLAVARRRAADAHAPVTFDHGDAHGLAYGDRSFDAVVCLRVLMHTPGWRESLTELCRVARSRVVFDYPALMSAAAIQAAARQGGPGRRVARRSLPRVQRSLGSRRARQGRVSASPISTGSSSCPSRFTSASARSRRPSASKARCRGSGCGASSVRR